MKDWFILSLDPSGNWFEGKGTTGWCVFSTADKRVTLAGNIFAGSYPSAESYWAAHIALLAKLKSRYKSRFAIVVEDYLLYASKAGDQINSRMETPKLIGVLQLWAYQNHVPLLLEPASAVKTRWSNTILHHKGYIRNTRRGYEIPGVDAAATRHCLDAVRHAVHVATFRLEDVQNAYKRCRTREDM